MKNIYFSALCLLAGISCIAQQIDPQIMENMSMRCIGPAGMSGRVTAIDMETNHPENIYVGTASGGVWKSESGGITWKPIFDSVEVLGIGALGLNPYNSDEIWVGTGEGNPRNSHTSGAGIYKTLDGGKSWELSGLEATKNIHRVIVNDHNTKEVYVAALGSIWGPNPERGVYRTRDGGENWENVLFVNDSTGCAELIQDPSNPNKLLAAMWEYGRKPWTFNSGGEGSGIYITYDGGDHWKKLGAENGLPAGTLGRCGLAISAANPDVIYALIESEKTGLYKTTDGGSNWSLVSTENIGNRPFYYAEIHADPQDENTIYNLWSYLSKSIDGGKTFNTIMDYPAYHPDHHAFYIHPHNSDFMIEGNDGGLNITRDGGKNWEFVRNLPLGQFYHINVDDKTPYNVYGGMQDNGSWIGPGFVWHVDGIRNEDWKEILFGDGFDVAPIPVTDEAYAMYQGGAVQRVHIPTGKTTSIQPIHPEGETLRFNWNGAISIDPHSTDGIYMGSQYLHYSADRGNSWKILSPDLTTNDTLKQKQAESGGLTLDATQAENYTTITCIAPSPLNKNKIWVGTDDGRIHATSDSGNTWKELKIKGIPSGAWVAQITASAHDENEVFISVNNYRKNDFRTFLYHSSNDGKSWKNLLASDDIKGFSHCLVQDPVEANLLFAGTEHGLYVSTNKGNDWTKWNKDFPSVAVTDLKIQADFKDLIIGTFGRAAYILDDLEPLRELAKNNANEFTADFRVFSPQKKFQSSIARPNGERFRADHFFQGENKPWSAQIFYYLNETDTLLEKEDQKIHVNILSAKGDSIRTFKVDAEEGFHAISWNLDADGIRFPSRSIPKPDAPVPGGGVILPGEYQVHLKYGELTSSTSINVLSDPRKETTYPNTFLTDIAEVKNLVNQATKTFTALQKARKSAEYTKGLLAKYEADTAMAYLTDSTEAIIKRIDKLEEWYMSPRGQVGYEHVTVRLNNMLYKAYELATETELRFEEGSNSYLALQRAKSKYLEAKAEINSFLITEFLEYRTMIEAQKLTPFLD